MAKKTLLSRLHQPVHPVLSFVLIGLVSIGGISALALRAGLIPHFTPQQYQSQKDVTYAPPPTYTPTISPTPVPPTTYTSDKLGISFSYIPVLPTTGLSQYIFTREIGDKVYLYDDFTRAGVNQPFPGTDADFLQKIAPGSKYVEVFTKAPQQSLYDAIKQNILTGYSENDCFVSTTPYDHPRQDESFETAAIDFPRHLAQTRMQLNALAAKCTKYVTFIGLSYFMMAPKHPNKFLFIMDGEDNLPSGIEGLTWDGTIKVLQ